MMVRIWSDFESPGSEGIEDDIVNEELQAQNNSYDDDYDVFGHDSMGIDAEDAPLPAASDDSHPLRGLEQLYPRFPWNVADREDHRLSLVAPKHDYTALEAAQTRQARQRRGRAGANPARSQIHPLAYPAAVDHHHAVDLAKEGCPQ